MGLAPSDWKDPRSGAMEEPAEGHQARNRRHLFVDCPVGCLPVADPTPPPVLDQILVASFGIWFANEAIDRKNKDAPTRTITTNPDGSVSVSEAGDDEPTDQRSG